MEDRMTFEEFHTIIRSNGPAGKLVLHLETGTEMTLRGNWSINAQMDLFRERILFSSPWTEVWIDIRDINDFRVDGKRTVITLKTGAIAWIPRT
jgi:hypothetical protein